MITQLQNKGIRFFLPGEHKNSRHGWIQLEICPFCGDSKAHFGITENLKTSNCYKCGKHRISEVSKALDIQFPHSLEFQYIPKEKSEEQEVEKPPLLQFLTPHDRNYLRKRGFNDVLMERKFGLRSTRILSTHPYSVFIPCNADGWICRASTENPKLRYHNSKGFKFKDYFYNSDQVFGDWIVICEGIFDSWKLGRNAVASYGVNLSEKQKLQIIKYKKVVIAFDNDEAGRKESEKIERDLGPITEIFKIPEHLFQGKKDAGDFDSSQVFEYRKWLEKEKINL